MIEQFHFIRPEWLFALVLPGLALWLLRRRGYDSGNWRAVIDTRLLPYVLSSDGSRHGNRLPWILSMVATIAIVALAGSTWEKQQQAMYQQRSALVVAEGDAPDAAAPEDWAARRWQKHRRSLTAPIGAAFPSARDQQINAPSMKADFF